MYTVINQCCPNRRLATCSSTVVTPLFCARVMWCPPRPLGWNSHSHWQSSPSFCKVPSPESRKTWNCKSGIQTFGISPHWSQIKITIGLPLHMVPKKDGSWRPCGNYRCLNFVTTPNKYPLPNIQDLSNGLHGCNFFFSKTTLVKGYHQIPVAAADIPKMVIIMPFGLFEYLFTSFRLSKAAQTFQRMMDRTTDSLDGVFAFMDNPCGFSRQVNTPPFGSLFQCFGHQWSRHQSWKMCFCSALFRDSWPHDFSNRIDPHGRSHCQNGRRFSIMQSAS